MALKVDTILFLLRKFGKSKIIIIYNILYMHRNGNVFSISYSYNNIFFSYTRTGIIRGVELYIFDPFLVLWQSVTFNPVRPKSLPQGLHYIGHLPTTDTIAFGLIHLYNI